MTKPKAHQLTDFIMRFCMVVIAIFLLTCAYWELRPYKTLVVNNVNIVNPDGTIIPSTQTAKVLSGNPVYYRINYCKYVSVQASLYREVVGNNNHYPLPIVTGNVAVSKGCNDFVNSNALIGTAIPAGVYYLDIAATYQVNPIRKVTYRYRTPSFEVVK